MSEQFAKALVDAGIIDFPIGSLRRIVIDAQAGHVLMVYVEMLADERWLSAGVHMEGIEVHTSAPPQDSRESRHAAQNPAVSAGAPASGE